MTRRQAALAGQLGLLTFAALMSACQYDPYTFRYATKKPDLQSIVGVWVATDETLRDLSGTEYSKAKPTIVVSADGSIRMTAIPDTWRATSDQGSGKLEEFVGTWQLEQHQHRWWGLVLRQRDWGCDGCLMVVGNKLPHKLVIRYADPDEGRGYEFRKTG